MFKTKTPIAVFALLALFALLQAGVREKDVPDDAVLLTGKGVAIEALLADTDAERIQGLSGKEELRKNEGMLFVFPKAAFHGIWMKDMLFPIDIIWLNDINRKPQNDANETQKYAEGRTLIIVDIEENAGPETFPEVFYPKEPAAYVLELPAGFMKKENLTVGDIITIEKTRH
ncbi:MAG: DUF192 domain-containing protein [bacterium]|nr:DUF192 domain-containing protein [bacterium]